MIRTIALLGVAGLLGATQAGPNAAPPRSGKPIDPPPEAQLRRVPVGAPVPVGPGISDGDPVFDTPQPVAGPAMPDSVPLAQDAVIASETLRLMPLHFRLAGPVAIGPPFNLSLPAGSDVGRLVKDGAIRHCLKRHGIFTPPQDGEGEIYPAICFEDRDGDGSFETAVLLPYHPQRSQPRVVSIAPVRLEPNPAATAGDAYPVRLTRRIRVAHVDASEVLIVADQGLAAAGQAEVVNFSGRPQDSLTLPLRDGASGSLGGLALRLVRDGAGWRIAATGRLAPWLEVRENSNLIVAGGIEFRRRPSP